jgi:predicted RNase H-like HicB family nuclease
VLRTVSSFGVPAGLNRRQQLLVRGGDAGEGTQEVGADEAFQVVQHSDAQPGAEVLDDVVRRRTLGTGCFFLRNECDEAGRGLMKYKIAVKQTEEGFSVSVPGLPGCWSQGATEKEALENIQAAIQEYLAARDEILKDSVVREVEVAG